jgi:hypothetical protein
VYETATGKIIRTQSGNCDLPPEIEAGQSVLEILEYVTDSTHYVDVSDPQTPVPTPKNISGVSVDKLIAIANGIDKVTLSNLPNPSDVLLTGPDTAITTEVTDGTLEVTFISPGMYTLLVESVEEYTTIFELEAT